MRLFVYKNVLIFKSSEKKIENAWKPQNQKILKITLFQTGSCLKCLKLLENNIKITIWENHKYILKQWTSYRHTDIITKQRTENMHQETRFKTFH